MEGSLALSAMAGCSRGPRPGFEPRVSIVKAGYDQDLPDKLRRLLADHKVEVRGKRVVLKPNLVEFDDGAAINTHPLLVMAALVSA